MVSFRRLLLLLSALAGVSGQGVKLADVKLSTYSAGQQPFVQVSFTPTVALTGDVVAPATTADTITVSVNKLLPASAAPIFKKTGTCSITSINGCDSLAPTLPDALGLSMSFPLAAGASCTISAGVPVQFTIPGDCLQLNPTVGTIVWLQVSTTKQAAATVAAPYATNAGLLVPEFLPASLTGAAAPTSLTFKVIPAQSLAAGDTITFQANGLGVAMFTTQPAGTAFGTIGRCSATAQSTVQTATTQSTLFATLGGADCALPARVPFGVTITAPFLDTLVASTDDYIRVSTSKEPTGQYVSYTVANPAAGNNGQVTWGGATPSTLVAGQVPTSLKVKLTLATPLIAADRITLAMYPAWVFAKGSTASVTTDAATCAVAITATAFANGGGQHVDLPAAGCTLPAGPVTLTYTGGFLPNLPVNSTVTFSVRTTKDSTFMANLTGYTTTGGCGVMPSYTPGDAGDIKSMSDASRATLASNIGYLSWNDLLTLPCNATSGLLTYAKIPYTTFPTVVSVRASPLITITSWGTMQTTPMEAVVVSYPPTGASLSAVGISPAVPSGYTLLWLVKIDIFNNTGGYYPNVSTGAPIQFTVANTTTTLVLAFNEAGSKGVDLKSADGMYGMTSNNTLLVQSQHLTVFAGFGPLAVASPPPVPPAAQGGSDAAWVGFVAFVALPLLCCCILAWWLWNRRRRAFVPCMVMQPNCQCAPMMMMDGCMWPDAQQVAFRPGPCGPMYDAGACAPPMTPVM